MTAGQAIKAWREYQGMSQYQLSEAIGIHRAQIGAWEAERHSPTFDSMERLASFFETDVLGFLAGPTAPEVGVQPAENLIKVALYGDLASLMAGDSEGAFAIPADLKGCVAFRVSEDTHGWLQAAPEVRADDVWALRPGGKARDGKMVVVIPDRKGSKAHHASVGVWRQRHKVVEPVHPGYPALPVEGLRVLAVAEALVWRDYRRGVRR